MRGHSFDLLCSVKNPRSPRPPITMNKSLMLVLIPCLVAYVMAQYYQPGYGGMAGYGGGYGPGTYYNYAAQSAQGAKTSNLLNYGLLFFAILILTNATGSITG
ncbi:uncharacterized protein LOC110441983 isoform X1 [Mizuhopecten yessoensis]|uniref:Uncharacterized protein n=2 Tax=Mizuhopecten yessoensis TaxID=6573 RepID=A0A210PIA2_MIZYE|nr:uncharacterized protein LOC110441983 isoform X1 [Mizuhopecten yessoensis]OWF36211.1 hypothetical protein KP79_PYT16917 [Mizuhopecten yessoensis]